MEDKLKLAKLKLRIRFDFVSKGKKSKIFGGKNSEEMAEEIRQHKASLIRNVPVQGIHIEDIDMGQEVYSICDEITGKIVSYAPVIISFSADSLEDVLQFAMKEEFRTVEVLEPEEIVVSKLGIERLLLKINEELLDYKEYLEKKIDNWK